MDAKVVPEPNNGSSTNSSWVGRVGGAARTQQKRVLKRVSGYGGIGLENGLWEGKRGKEGEVRQRRDLRRDLDLGGLRSQDRGDFRRKEEIGG